MKSLFIIRSVLAGLLLICANMLYAQNIRAANPLQIKNQDEISSEKLILNNGTKWKVDQTTNSNVNNLKQILKRFDNNTDRSLKTYKKAGCELQNGLVKMMNECRMEGPNHLALHKWLEPLMAQVAKLKQASTVAVTAKYSQAVELRLSQYDQYFEL